MAAHSEQKHPRLRYLLAQLASGGILDCARWLWEARIKTEFDVITPGLARTGLGVNKWPSIHRLEPNRNHSSIVDLCQAIVQGGVLISLVCS